MDKPNPTQVAKDLSRLANTFNETDLKLLAELVVNDHRSLQQSIMRGFVWPLLQAWSEDFEANRYDLRNEATVKLAHDIVSANPEMGFPWV